MDLGLGLLRFSLHDESVAGIVSASLHPTLIK